MIHHTSSRPGFQNIFLGIALGFVFGFMVLTSLSGETDFLRGQVTSLPCMDECSQDQADCMTGCSQTFASLSSSIADELSLALQSCGTLTAENVSTHSQCMAGYQSSSAVLLQDAWDYFNTCNSGCMNDFSICNDACASASSLSMSMMPVCTPSGGDCTQAGTVCCAGLSCQDYGTGEAVERKCLAAPASSASSAPQYCCNAVLGCLTVGGVGQCGSSGTRYTESTCNNECFKGVCNNAGGTCDANTPCCQGFTCNAGHCIEEQYECCEHPTANEGTWYCKPRT